MSKLNTRGEGNAQAKLNHYQVNAIRQLHKNKVGYRKLSKFYNISISQIRRIVKHENWAWL